MLGRKTRGGEGALYLARGRGPKRGAVLLIGLTCTSETPAGLLVKKLGAAVSLPFGRPEVGVVVGVRPAGWSRA